MKPSPHKPRPLRGVALFTAAVVFFACLDATAKHLSRDWPIGVLAWGRYLGHWLLMTVFLAPTWGRRLIRTRRPVAVSARGALLVLITLLMMAAFKRMPLAEATSIMFASPLLVALAAGPFLGERIGALRWAAILVGFAGVLLLTRPGNGLDTIGVLCTLIAAVANTAYQLMTRKLIATEHPVTMLYITALIGAVGLTLALPLLGPLHTPTWLETLQFLSLGFFGGCGHYLFTRAFREAPASLLSPLMYTQLIWAGLFGWQFFDNIPGGAALAGMGVICVAGIMIALDGRREANKAGAAPDVG